MACPPILVSSTGEAARHGQDALGSQARVGPVGPWGLGYGCNWPSRVANPQVGIAPMAHWAIRLKRPSSTPHSRGMVIDFPRLSDQHRFDVLANVEPTPADLDTRQDVSTRPIFNSRDGSVQESGHLACGHHVICREPLRRGCHRLPGSLDDASGPRAVGMRGLGSLSAATRRLALRCRPAPTGALGRAHAACLRVVVAGPGWRQRRPRQSAIWCGGWRGHDGSSRKLRS
jgi:hypothetical protein